jgi:endonuclease-3
MIKEKDIPILKKRVFKIIKILEKLFPDAKISLNYSNNWELLVAVELSAQCTDKKVNEVTEKLFKKYKTLKDYLKADLFKFEQDIRQTGFYHSKAKNILSAAKMINDKFNGIIPDNMEELLQIPGVGRKTANVVLGNAYGVSSGIAIDTHVKRLSNVLGISKEKTPEKIEKDLMLIVPREYWNKFTYLLIEYGRKYCVARKHNHNLCPLINVLK